MRISTRIEHNISSNAKTGIYATQIRILPSRKWHKYSDILSNILSGIYSDILSDFLSGILSGIYSDILSGISLLTFFLASILSFYLASIQAFILAFCLAFSLAFTLACVRVQACPSAFGARDRVRVQACQAACEAGDKVRRGKDVDEKLEEKGGKEWVVVRRSEWVWVGVKELHLC